MSDFKCENRWYITTKSKLHSKNQFWLFIYTYSELIVLIDFKFLSESLVNKGIIHSPIFGIQTTRHMFGGCDTVENNKIRKPNRDQYITQLSLPHLYADNAGLKLAGMTVVSRI